MSAADGKAIAADMYQARALIVDDDLVTRRLIRNALEKTACTVTEAADGLEAQALLQSSEFDVVTTDLRMPGLDGLSLMRWAAVHAPGPVWIIVSGVDSFDAAVEAVRLGAYEFLSKPPHAAQLQIIVRNALERRMLEVERRRLHDELEESHRALAQKVRELEASSDAMQRDLQRAEIIQRVLLPSEPPPLDGLCLHTLYRPGRFVGGDLYNVVRLTDRHLALYVADATGHGVSSAMLSVLFHRKLVLMDANGSPLLPDAVFAAVNRSICAERIAPGLFLTAAYCLIDTVQQQATMALAGHPPAMLRRQNGDVVVFQRTGPALGLAPDAVYRNEQFALQHADRLLLYTDGLIDNAADMHAARNLMESLLASAEDDADDILQQLAHITPAGSMHNEDRDDVTLLLLEARPGASRFDNGAAQLATSPNTASAHNAVVFYGETENASFFFVRGRGTWLHADSFHGAAASLLDEGIAVVLDLSECEYLDSTFLGTIHELSGRASARATFRVQHVQPVVRALFEELDMHRVLESVSERPTAVPADIRPLALTGDAAGPQARILRAHETLAGLSERNRDRFKSVLDAMQGARGPRS